MPANSGTFADLFAFSRASTAEYRDATGTLQIAAVDAPRFDHSSDGTAMGLLLAGSPEQAEPDRLPLAADLPDAPALGTVLHDYVTPAGKRRMRAIYSRNPRAMIEGLLALKGHHRRIGFFPTFLPRTRAEGRPTSPVMFGGEAWEMAGLIMVAPLTALDTGSAHNPLLIEA
jgi:hypothetical protein